MAPAIARPTGHLTSTEKPRANQKTMPARRPSASPARQVSKAARATQIRKHSTMSGCTDRALSQNMYEVARMNAPRIAVRSEDQRSPKRRVKATVPSAARTEGRRAVNEVTSAKGSDRSAISQK